MTEIEKAKLMECSSLRFGNQIEERYIQWLKQRNPKAAEAELRRRRNGAIIGVSAEDIRSGCALIPMEAGSHRVATSVEDMDSSQLMSYAKEANILW